jgi:hypothetical protein
MLAFVSMTWGDNRSAARVNVRRIRSSDQIEIRRRVATTGSRAWRPFSQSIVTQEKT